MNYDNQIVFFTPSFPKNEENTIAVPTIYLLAKSLKKQLPTTTKITVLALHFPFDAIEYQCFGIDVISLGGANKSYPKRFLTWRKSVQKIKALHSALPIKLIHIFWMSECAFLASRFFPSSIPKLVTLMGQDTEKQNRFIRLIDKSIPFIGINSIQKDKMKEFGFTNFQQNIPWGVEENQPIANFKNRPIDLLFVSTFIPLKEPLFFLEICSDLIKEYPDLKITMVGYGPLEHKVKSFISGHNLPVEIIPKLKREEVFELYQKSKVLVHTSNFEAFGMVIPEALNNGCKVVSRKVGCAFDYKSENWSIAETKAEFVGAIKQQWNSKFENDFPFSTFDEIGKGYLNLYQKISEG